MKASIVIGQYRFESEAKDLKEQLLELSNMKPRHKCDVCGNTSPSKFAIRARKTKVGNFIYVENVCFNETGDNTICYAKSELGSLKDGGYFWKKFERYIPTDVKEDE